MSAARSWWLPDCLRSWLRPRPVVPEQAPEAAGAGGERVPNPLGIENTDFVTPQGYAAKNGALGIIMVPSFQQLSTMANPNAGGGRGPGLNGPSYQVVKFQAARPASVPTITAGLESTNALFQNTVRN